MLPLQSAVLDAGLLCLDLLDRLGFNWIDLICSILGNTPTVQFVQKQRFLLYV